MPKFIYSQSEFDIINANIIKVINEKNKIIKTLCNKLVGLKSPIKSQARVNVKIPSVDISCIYDFYKPLDSYILTEEEHKHLSSLEHRVIADKNKTIADVCMQLMNTIPMASPADIGYNEVILGCVRNSEIREDLVNPFTCDDCPLLDTCEYDNKKFIDV